MMSLYPGISSAEFLKAIVGTPSLSGQEKSLADALEAFLSIQGFSPQRAGNNIWFTLGSVSGPTLLLNSHIDTVPPNANWVSDPFRPEWRESRLTGLGANDAKGAVTAIIFAALRLKQDHFQSGRVLVALSCEEETGGQGLGTIISQLGPLEAAVVGEPTGLRVVSSQRGLLILKCTARGMSGHVANAQMLGTENAIAKASRDIVKIEQLVLPSHPTLGMMKAHVTQIQGGLKRNQIPDHCEFYLDIRTNPESDHVALTHLIQSHLESEVTIHSDRYLPKWTNPQHPIVMAALKAAKKEAPTSSATTSDWAFLKDIPAVKVGPGDTFRSHRPDEYLLLSELEEGICFYRDTVLHFFEKASV